MRDSSAHHLSAFRDGGETSYQIKRHINYLIKRCFCHERYRRTTCISHQNERRSKFSKIAAHQRSESAAHQPLALAAHHLWESCIRSTKDSGTHQVSAFIDSGVYTYQSLKIVARQVIRDSCTSTIRVSWTSTISYSSASLIRKRRTIYER